MKLNNVLKVLHLKQKQLKAKCVISKRRLKEERALIFRRQRHIHCVMSKDFLLNNLSIEIYLNTS